MNKCGVILRSFFRVWYNENNTITSYMCHGQGKIQDFRFRFDRETVWHAHKVEYDNGEPFTHFTYEFYSKRWEISFSVCIIL